jgi:hypothetical protein
MGPRKGAPECHQLDGLRNGRPSPQSIARRTYMKARSQTSQQYIDRMVAPSTCTHPSGLIAAALRQ